MSNFEDRGRKKGKRDESKDLKRDEGLRSPGQESGSEHSYGSPSSGQSPERHPGSHPEDGRRPEESEERPGRSRPSPSTEEEED